MSRAINTRNRAVFLIVFLLFLSVFVFAQVDDDLIKKIQPAIVSIDTINSGGSGVVVGEQDLSNGKHRYLIATAEHVIRDQKHIFVNFYDDTGNDLADVRAKVFATRGKLSLLTVDVGGEDLKEMKAKVSPIPLILSNNDLSRGQDAISAGFDGGLIFNKVKIKYAGGVWGGPSTNCPSDIVGYGRSGGPLLVEKDGKLFVAGFCEGGSPPGVLGRSISFNSVSDIKSLIKDY